MKPKKHRYLKRRMGGARRWMAGLLACAALATPTMGQSSQRLIDALIRKGILTEQEAREIIGELEPPQPATAPAPLVRPSSANIRDLQIRGRIQAQFGYTHAENDAGSDDYGTFEMRRVRLGLRGTLFQNVRAQLEANLIPNEFSMRSAYLEWREHSAAMVRIGLEKPMFGFEETTSSAAIITVERSQINNQMWAAPAQITGLSAQGAISAFRYGAGIYTGRANVNPDGLDRYLYNASVGVVLDPWLPEGRRLSFRADGIANDDAGANFRYEYGLAASGHYVCGPFDLRVEYLQGHPFSGGNVRGGYIMPSCFITQKLQGVLRYEKAAASRTTIGAPSRYARRTEVSPSDVSGARAGTDYQAIYGGLNYYVRGDDLKLMGGLEYSELENTSRGTLSALTLYGAVRMLF